MTYDDVISTIGGFGRYQRRILFILCLPLLSSAFHTMAGVFLTAKTDFRCLLPHENPENVTYQLPTNLSSIYYPWDYDTNDWSDCERYDINFTNQLYVTDENISLTTSTIKCDSYVYDKTIYQLTATTEFNLVCDNSWLTSITDSLFMVGVMVGGLIFGGLSDKYGRRPIFYLALLVQAIGGLLVAASPNIILYIILRFIMAATSTGTFIIIYVTALEMVVPDKRLTVAVTIELFFSSGYVLTTAFAYFITNWRFLQIAITIPNVAFLTYWWFIPESTRWLVTTGRLDEAKDSLLKIASENKVKISRDQLDVMLKDCSLTKPELDKLSVFDLLKYPNLRRKSLLLFFNWFINNATYYGLSWNTSSLVGNEYLNFALAGLVEIPAHVFVFLTLNKLGRKSILCSALMLSGISLVLTIFVPDDVSWLTVVFTMMGKLAITASYEVVYILTAEQYPTVLRNVGIGACSTCARIGGIIAPYINYSSTFWTPLPAVVFGSGSLIAGMSTLLLPETVNQKLPESIQDSEQFGKRNKESCKTSNATKQNVI